MFSQQPWYHNSPPNVSHNPRSSPFAPVPTRLDPAASVFDDEAEERRRALAERRARRAQWLPDEQDDDDVYEDEDVDWAYQRRKQEEALLRQRALEEQRKLEEQQRQDALRKREEQEQRRQEELRQRKEVEDTRQRSAEQRRRLAAEQQKNIHSSKPTARATPARFVPGGRQGDASTPIPIHFQTSQPKQTPPPSPPSKAAEVTPEPAQDGIPGQRSQTSSRPTSPAQSPEPRATHTVEEQNLAASRIQQQYRIHSSFCALSELENQFNTLKKGFVYPVKIDFQKPGSDDAVISVPAYRPPSDFDLKPGEGEDAPVEVDNVDGKMAYTSTNYALNTYSDQLDKLLMKLDGVESWGHRSVRMRRRGIVKAIERETSKLDRYWRQAWADYVEKQSVKPASTGATTNDSQTESDAQPI